MNNNNMTEGDKIGEKPTFGEREERELSEAILDFDLSVQISNDKTRPMVFDFVEHNLLKIINYDTPEARRDFEAAIAQNRELVWEFINSQVGEDIILEVFRNCGLFDPGEDVTKEGLGKLTRILISMAMCCAHKAAEIA
jgi:hypothetical protein